MIVFLDLEETLINNWSDARFLPKKIRAIKKFIDSNSSVRLGLMSWAVWDAMDLNHMFNTIQPELEQFLDQRFSPEFLWSMDDWASQVLMHTNKSISRDDMFDMFGKEEVLFRLARKSHVFTGQEIVLIDDAVDHELAIHCPTNSCTVKFINVDELVKSS